MSLSDLYTEIRAKTLDITSPLLIEDFVVQSCDDVSPPKWHLGHTTWFFHQIVLKKYLPGFETRYDPLLSIFNSYYKTFGEHWTQSLRGVLSRPSVSEIIEYRSFVDEKMIELLNEKKDEIDFKEQVILGLHHEQQHQELLMMDIKHILGTNPLYPTYKNTIDQKEKVKNKNLDYLKVEAGMVEIGMNYDDNSTYETFCYDNETPKNKQYLNNFAFANRLVSNEEFLNFIKDGGYKKPSLWHSEGWDFINKNNISRPLYWNRDNNSWREYRLNGGNLELDLNAPVMNISFYEASAFALWYGSRLPFESEWEFVANSDELVQKIDDLTHCLWQWTCSSYSPYPGYKYLDGAFREYNSKFMISQQVLRGGCSHTPRNHFRKTYRNFYYPAKRWCFSGIRLCKDL